MISELERTAVANRAAELRAAGYTVDISLDGGSCCVVQDPTANADEEPLIGPVMTFDPPAAKPTKAGNFDGQADAGAEQPMTAPKMMFERD